VIGARLDARVEREGWLASKIAADKACVAATKDRQLS
jgi:hypothetical protein